MKAGEIKFRHQYYKLAKPEFTTIRGRSQFQRYRGGEIVDISTPKGNFKAEVTAVDLQKPSDMPLDFIKADAEYPGCVLQSVDDFIALLNSFRAPEWKKASKDEEMTVIYLRKLKDTVKDTNELIELFTGLVKGLIRYPADLKVTETQLTRKTLCVALQAHADDTGKLIGDQGVMIAALREIAKHMGFALGLKVRVDVLEPVTGKKERGESFRPNPEYQLDGELQSLEALGRFIFNESAKVQYHADSEEKTTLILLVDAHDYDVESELGEAIDTLYRATGLAKGRKLAVELDCL